MRNEEEESCLIDDDIILTHPLLYRECKSFEFGEGWLKLVEKMSDELEDILWDIGAEMKGKRGQIPYVVQIKEKFGTLRVYFSTSTDAMEEIVDKYRHKSSITCEVCGKSGSLRSNGSWAQTLCTKCEKRNKNHLNGWC